MPPRAKICFSHFTTSILEWNVKNYFVKLIKTIKVKNFIKIQLELLLFLAFYKNFKTILRNMFYFKVKCVIIEGERARVLKNV